MNQALAVAQPGCSSADLERVFHDCFYRSEHTVLCGGAQEPFYEPGSPHRLYYREDYFASALHEIAHWCIAGKARRQQPDFGYWYAPEGRNTQQQAAFEAVEAKPQALEWFFSLACAYPFRVSADNLSADGALVDNTGFRQQVAMAAKEWQSRGLPARAQQFFDALSIHYGTGRLVSDLVLSADSLE